MASQRLDWQALIAEQQVILTTLRHDAVDTAYRIAHTHLQHMIADQLTVIASSPDYFLTSQKKAVSLRNGNRF
ncbi:hypothetical protein [Weissella confusa]|uniref:hypothetical protein n=1 Tax=Weissella confusa TaxID=1583 RepID=UPI0018F155EF|nr:hypothetical protein [Weissella confusa]MBJ7617128.1 hypothetical protein [Weissella confusa]